MRADSIAGVIFIALAIFIYSVNWQMTFEPALGDPGSTLLPSVVAVIMAVCGALLTFQALMKARMQPMPEKRQAPLEPPSVKNNFNLVLAGSITTAALLGYVLLLPYLGYLVSTVLFFTAASWALGKHSLGATCIYLMAAVVVASVTYYALSRGLKISLPTSVWSP